MVLNIAATVRKPRWIAAIVVGLLLAGVFVRLGMWQLDRYAERRDRNAMIQARTDEPVRLLAGLRGDLGDDPDALAFRRAAVEGSYRADQEFKSVGRVYGFVMGTLVATPLELHDGTVLIVLRGIVPPSIEGPPMVGYETPGQPVLVEGRIAPGENASRIRESVPDDGNLTQVSRIDLEYIDQFIDGDVLPYMLLLDEQRPAGTGEAPTRIPNEELTNGSHLGYAVQWFAFALIAIVGTGALIVRESRSSVDESGSESVRIQS